MHDARMLAVSELYDDLETVAFCPAGREMCLHGDPAFSLRIHLQAPFRIAVLTRQMNIFNEKMSAVRASVKVVICGHRQLFQISRFQKEFEDRFKSSWQDVHSLCNSTKRFKLPLF